MIRHLTTALRGLTHVLVAIDKFTKWIEYKLMTSTSTNWVIDFTGSILYHFSFPDTIIIDLGSNFTANTF